MLSANVFWDEKPALLITGAAGLIGSRLVEAFSSEFEVVGMDIVDPPVGLQFAGWSKCDMTDDDCVESEMANIRACFGPHLASVIHLAAYYDFSGEPSPLYETLTVQGTARMLRELQKFDAVEQFIFSSTLLVMKPADEGEALNAASPLQAEWDYPKSKLAAEQVIREQRGRIPALILRIAGVYDEMCHSVPIAQQIARIYGKELESYVFPGDKTHGQAFIHLDDLVDCFQQAVHLRRELPEWEVLLIGEEGVLSYDDLQKRLGLLIHSEAWPTIRVPKAMAKAGAWLKEKIAPEGEKPFIKPWMVDLADQHYPVDLRRARGILKWQPKHHLQDALAPMIENLKRDPQAWFAENKLPMPVETPELTHFEPA